MHAKQQQKQCKRSVRFAEQQKVVLVPHFLDLENATDIWISDVEYSKIVDSYQDTIERMESGDIPQGHSSRRGLECRTFEAAALRMKKRYFAYNDVLDEQERQWLRATKSDTMAYDDDAIAAVYSKHTAICAEEAARRGMDDEKAALMVYQGQRRSKRFQLQKKSRSEITLTGAKKAKSHEQGKGVRSGSKRDLFRSGSKRNFSITGSRKELFKDRRNIPSSSLVKLDGSKRKLLADSRVEANSPAA